MIYLRSVVLILGVVASGCGDDQMGAPDAPVGPVYNYDLSCLGMEPAAVDATIRVHGWMADQSNVGDWPSIAFAPVRFETIDGATVLASGTTADNGTFDLDVMTGGRLTPTRVAAEPMFFPKQRWYGTRAPWRIWTPESENQFFGAGIGRVNRMLFAAGQTRDDTKGTIEVWISDCAFKPMTGATVSITEEPDTQWIMYTGAGVWVRGTTTEPAVEGRAESVAGAVNIAPGVKHLTVTANGMEIGSVTLTVEPDSFNTVVVFPGYFPMGAGF